MEEKAGLCIVTNAYPDANIDHFRGLNYYNLISALKTHHPIDVVTPRFFADSATDETAGNEKLHRFRFLSSNKLLNEYERTPVLPMSTYLISGLVECLRVVRRGRCRLIHAHCVIPSGLIAVIAGMILRRPVVVSAHGSDILLYPDRSKLMRLATRYVLKRAALVTIVARHMMRKISELGLEQCEVVWLPMGVRCEDFNLNAKPLPEYADLPMVISNRNFAPVYNLEQLIRAAPLILEEVPGTRVLVAGEGWQEDAIRTLAVELNVGHQVSFLGRIPHHLMPRYLATATVYVSTSLSDGLSVSLLEAMACGTFPVVTDIPANREWIRDGENGFLIPVGDPEKLALGVVRALKDRSLVDRAATVNSQTVRSEASWDRVVEILEEHYDRLLSEGTGG